MKNEGKYTSPMDPLGTNESNGHDLNHLAVQLLLLPIGNRTAYSPVFIQLLNVTVP